VTPLAATLLALLTVWHGPDPVYARHLRRHPRGPVARAEQLAGQLTRAARRARVELPLLVALALDESAVDHEAVSPVGAVGALQLLPASPWGRGWLRARRGVTPAEDEALNALWGAYALRDGLRACGGDPGRALGFYRAGRCLEGPRARHTLALARTVRAHMEKRL
jgi:hypothetical protein